jgi:hypothetical protein
LPADFGQISLYYERFRVVSQKRSHTGSEVFGVWEKLPRAFNIHSDNSCQAVQYNFMLPALVICQGRGALQK